MGKTGNPHLGASRKERPAASKGKNWEFNRGKIDRRQIRGDGSPPDLKRGIPQDGASKFRSVKKKRRESSTCSGKKKGEGNHPLPQKWLAGERETGRALCLPNKLGTLPE